MLCFDLLNEFDNRSEARQLITSLMKSADFKPKCH